LVVDKKKDGSDGYKPSRFSFVVLPSVSLGCFSPSHLLFTSSLGLALLQSVAMIPGLLAFFLLHTSPFVSLSVFVVFPFSFRFGTISWISCCMTWRGLAFVVLCLGRGNDLMD
jgi:hypothetical protein